MGIMKTMSRDGRMGGWGMGVGLLLSLERQLYDNYLTHLYDSGQRDRRQECLGNKETARLFGWQLRL